MTTAMQQFPNLAVYRRTDAIRLIGESGIEPTLLAFYHAVRAPDNVLILAIRSAGPPLVPDRQSDHPPVFSHLNQTYLAGTCRLDPFDDPHLRPALAGSCRIANIAASAAAYIAMAGDEVVMPENAFLMIHDPAWSRAPPPTCGRWPRRWTM